MHFIRIMSRNKHLDESDLLRIKSAMEVKINKKYCSKKQLKKNFFIQDSQLTAFYRYRIDQDFCEDDDDV